MDGLEERQKFSSKEPDKDNAKNCLISHQSHYNDRRTGIVRYPHCRFFSCIYGNLSKNWQYRVDKSVKRILCVIMDEM